MAKKRKIDHYNIALDRKIGTNDFDNIKLETASISTVNYDDINIESSFLGFDVKYPIYINAMTGGVRELDFVNEKLLQVANHFKIPFIFGSQSMMMKNEENTKYYQKPKDYSSVLVGNLSLNYNFDEFNRAKTLIEADAMSVHLNVIQELIMEEGDRDFSNWDNNLKDILKNKDFPLLVKEVGFGMSRRTINDLRKKGVKYIDVSGRGGTNFANIELKRKGESNSILNDLSYTTVESLLNARRYKKIDIYASGGIRNALDIVKSLMLGAKMVGMSKYFLDLTKLPVSEMIKEVEGLIKDIKNIMVSLNVSNLKELRKVKYVYNKGKYN